MTKQYKLIMKIVLGTIFFLGLIMEAHAASGIGGMATKVTGNLGAIAKLITAGSYVGGFGFVVAGIVKFKAHKDNPQQVHISLAIVLVFVGAALIFVPTVFKTTGQTMFSGTTVQGSVSGVSSF